MVWYADTPHCLSVQCRSPRYRVRRERTPTSSSAIWSNRELATPGWNPTAGDQLMVDAVIARSSETSSTWPLSSLALMA